MSKETILATLPSLRDDERTIVVLCHHLDSWIELRQQSFGAGVGWFTQNSVRLDPDQVAGLRGALGGVAPNRVPANLTRRDSGPRIVQFESA